ncbi:MAG: OmpA family protein [Saprospiraceae bacterium]|nr:OmpA family protein [Saprospiraceae bacterium]
MATRLTGFSKLLITVLLLAAIFFGGRYVLNNTGFGKSLQNKAQEAQTAQNDGSTTTNDGSTTNTGASKDPNTIKVQLVSWGGYAPGLYFNEGAAENANSRFFKEYGFKVDFKLENDLINALNGWTADQYDVIVQTADAFPLYTSADDINSLAPKAFMQVDWSRGGDAIIVKRGINKINDLKGKRIAVAVPSPAQTLVISSLAAAGLNYSDVSVVKTTDNIKAAELFKSNDVDAAVVWSPDDILSTQAVPGSKILLTTKDQSHIIADIFFAKESYLNANKDKIQKFYEGWMKGLVELQQPNNYDKAAKYLGELNGVSPDDAKGMMQNVYWTNHGDNMNFFGLNPSYKGVKGQELYEKMSKKFVETGDAEKIAPSWRSAIWTGAVTGANTALTGAAYGSEKPKVFTANASDVTAEAISTKPVSINFESGQFVLSENAKTIIDLQFAEVAKTFGNSKIRIEGNTDNVGSKNSNLTLSQKRAKSVADYLQKEYGMDPKKFVVVGNGPDKPVDGCESNATPDCKAKNRRTEFQLIAD